MRKTKIICTIGPASNNPETIRSLILSGMNVARFNFSHGTHEFHEKNINMVKDISKELGMPVATLMDLQGPKIRTGVLEHEVQLTKGQHYNFTARDIIGNDQEVGLTYSELPKEVKPGDHFFIDDGLLEFEVLEQTDTEIKTVVLTGGVLKNSKGLNLPDTVLSTPAMTDDDKDDLVFGISQEVDYVALSFVRSPEDILEIKAFMKKYCVDIPVIAKIEHPHALTKIDEIIAIADGIMVARGDLGVEVPFEEVPLIQKMLIKKCIVHGKPVITATQMLESMTQNKRPTRAEVTDITSAILDGTDAIMLSGETASGKYPVESVQVMARIAETAEREIGLPNYDFEDDRDLDESSISYAVKAVSDHMSAKFIVALTFSGAAAKVISQKRPSIPIIALTSNPKIRRLLTLHWGVLPYSIKQVTNVSEFLEETRNVIRTNKLCAEGEWIVLTGGLPLGKAQKTNALIIEKS